MLQIFTGRIPFDNFRHDYYVVLKVIAGLRPTQPVEATVLGLSDEIWTWMTKAWIEDPGQRPSLAELSEAAGDGNIEFVPWKDATTSREFDPPVTGNKY